jgi:hypothetical protein
MVDDSGVMTLVDNREKAMEASDMVAIKVYVEIKMSGEVGDASNETMILFYTVSAIPCIHRFRQPAIKNSLQYLHYYLLQKSSEHTYI